jgi:autotransporter strand-loop-strand O-heptosyltransferase
LLDNLSAQLPFQVAMPEAVSSHRASAETVSGTSAKKQAYPAPARVFTQEGPSGIRFDFNEGARVHLPEGSWTAIYRDLDTGNIVFQVDCGATDITSRKRHFLRFRIEVWSEKTCVMSHDYDARTKDVAVFLPVGTLGDSIGWLPYAVRFQEVHDCNLTVAMAPWLIPLFQDAYPHINMVSHEDFELIKDRFYASYYIGLFFNDEDNSYQPADFRLVGLHRTAGYILGVDPTEAAPKIVISDAEQRPIDQPYVVIAVQSSTQCKYWNNPSGWWEVIEFLKEKGYRVVCIDQKHIHGSGIVYNHIPYGAENQTGDRPLTERARWIKHAEFFIGLSSGLSWLAWAVGTPVVMISGFTHPTNEFSTPFRVFNTHACNSCWHDIRHKFEHENFFFCPRLKDTPRQFECTRLITADHVIQTIKRIPGVAEFGFAK